MKPFVEQVYLNEITRQCKEGIQAFNLSIHLMNSNSGAELVMGALDDVIDHASRVTLLLWPLEGQKTKKEEKQKLNDARDQRGIHLRSALNISDESPLRKKELRDHLHHFDERLDEWALKDGRSYIDSNIGPKNFIVSDGEPMVALRHFDPSNFYYSFRDDEYNLKYIADEMQVVYTKCASRIEDLERISREEMVKEFDKLKNRSYPIDP